MANPRPVKRVIRRFVGEASALGINAGHQQDGHRSGEGPLGLANGLAWCRRLSCLAQAYRDLDPDCLGSAPQKTILKLVKLIGTILMLGELEYISPGWE